MDLGLEALSKITYKLACPVCGKDREFASKSYFYKAKKYNHACKSCSNSLNAGGLGMVLYDENNQRCCIDCKQHKPDSEYYNNKSGKTSVCKSCSKERFKNYAKSTGRFKKYGITKEQFNDMIDNQNNQCAICNKELSSEIHIDHDHATGKVRGILCGKCNKGLGQFDDNVEFLRNAINYLDNGK